MKLLIKWFQLLPKKVYVFFNFVLFALKEYRKILNSDVIFFFPFYQTGGAETVHVNIVNTFKEQKTYIFFEKLSNSENNKSSFIKYSNFFEVYYFLNTTNISQKLFIKYLIVVINKSKAKSVFASNSNLFYKILPNLKNKIKKIDLTHAFTHSNYGGEIVTLPYVKYLTNRVVINRNTLLDFKELYLKHNLQKYYSRILIIQNGIKIGNTDFIEKDKKVINIGFVGRWAKEKRPELFLDIASKITSFATNYNFYFIGNNKTEKSKDITRSNIIDLGEIFKKDKLFSYYRKFHFIFITSKREGFPVVLMEAMKFGVVPICTNVGGISEHIFNNKNGYLIDNCDNEKVIIEKFIEKLISIKMDSDYLKLSGNAKIYANNNFNLKEFKNNYRKLLLE
ncbi:glycosyltransferase [uncultured Polaribacter sp.]|uniref:glycosyltransferase n=1 Tax=uncultured Polaribacter sp. TaxID=174711 RepID=UPI00262678C5|nr:glycosyltransferase [uncultured Polaribacter sp.]